MKNIISAFIMTLILVSTLVMALDTRPAKASTIVVPDDYPTIQEAINHANERDTIFVRNGTYYENIVVNKTVSLVGENRTSTIIDGNLIGNVMTIEVDEVSVANFSIRNSGHDWVYGLDEVDCGIRLKNNTMSSIIRGNVITNNYVGIYVYPSSNNTLRDNVVSNNEEGIRVISSSSFNNKILYNEVANNNGNGIIINSSPANELTANIVPRNKGIGLGLVGPNNVLRNNAMDSNLYNFYVGGNELEDFIYLDIDFSNTVNGKPIYYLIGSNGGEVPSDAGFIALVNCTDMIVQDFGITNEFEGLLLAYTMNSTVRECSFINNSRGLLLINSSYNSLINNTVAGNRYGIAIERSSLNAFAENSINNNWEGLRLFMAHNNSISANKIVNNDHGVYHSHSSSNRFYHNIFLGNVQQVDSFVSFVNFWDNDYPSGGNYWSDYSDVDLHSGPNQNEPGGDSIWGHPYVIDADNQDRYPLVNPSTHARVYVDPSMVHAAVGETFSVDVRVDVTDLAGFDFKLFWNTSLLDCVSATPTPPWDPFNEVRNEMLEDYNSTHGRYWCVYTLLNPASPFSGTSTLASLTFEVKTTGECPLNLYNVSLSDSQGSPIDGWMYMDSLEDGYVLAETVEWRFAMITDLHIGRGYTNYSWTIKGPFEEEYSGYKGEDYYLTERLENIVGWIKANAARYNIKFLVVLGDLSERGAQAELQKARDILDGLGDIPYFPVIGNHDDNTDGDSAFNSIFSSDFLIGQCEKLDDAEFWDGSSTVGGEVHLKNYAFKYLEKRFVFLDCVDRAWPDAQAKLWDDTRSALSSQLSYGEPTVLFSHHPMIYDEMSFTAFSFLDLSIIDYEIWSAADLHGTEVLSNFAGHIHGYHDPAPWKVYSDDYSFDSKREALSAGIGGLIFTPIFFNANGDYRLPPDSYITPYYIPVVTTEAMMVGSNEQVGKGVMRLGEVTGDEIASGTPTVSEGGPRSDALNPYLSVNIEGIGDHLWLWWQEERLVVNFEVYAFTKMFDATQPFSYSLFLDDVLREHVELSSMEPPYVFPDYELSKGFHDVALTVEGNTPDGRQVSESIAKRVNIAPFVAEVQCPVDIAVVDSSGRTISKQVNEIPGATYIEVDLDGDGDLDDLVIIPDSIDGDYVVALNGTGDGLYRMIVEVAGVDGVVNFTATEIPILLGALHQFTVDRDALSLGAKGVNVQVDSDGDGLFEYQFLSDSELNGTEFEQVIAHDVAIVGMSTMKSGCLPRETVGESKPLAINVTVQNQGLSPETFNVALYANDTLIESQQIILDASVIVTLTFHWNTTGYAKGNYLIRTVSSIVTNETDIADNTVNYGYTYLTLVGDVDGDQDVDIFDIVRMAVNYGCSQPDPCYDPNSDIDNDGDIDIFDIVAAATHYGESW